MRVLLAVALTLTAPLASALECPSGEVEGYGNEGVYFTFDEAQVTPTIHYVEQGESLTFETQGMGTGVMTRLAYDPELPDAPRVRYGFADDMSAFVFDGRKFFPGCFPAPD